MHRLRALDITALVLLIIGGLNWGLVALFDWDLVAAIFGAIPVLASIIYLLVAISAIYVAFRMPYLSHLHDRYPAERHGAHPVS